MMVFADAEAARRTRLWSHARSLGILPRLSLIEELEGRRDLLLQGDLLIVPEAKGEQRSVVLEAMATGMIVVAARDEMVSVLQDGRTARLVPGADARAWGEVLRDVLTHREKTRALTRSAAEYVRTQRRASEHVRAVLEAYRWLSGRDAIPFRGARGGA
jgi:glycosyltransferase involved in cell wall biosynthesis